MDEIVTVGRQGLFHARVCIPAIEAALPASVSPPYVPSRPHTRLKILSVAGQSCRLCAGEKAFTSALLLFLMPLYRLRARVPSLLSFRSYALRLHPASVGDERSRWSCRLAFCLTRIIRPSSFHFCDPFQVMLT